MSLKKKLRVLNQKKKKPLEYERFIKVKCPYCSKGYDIKKHIYIALPAYDIPDTIRCPKCDSVIYTKNILDEGLEIKRR